LFLMKQCTTINISTHVSLSTLSFRHVSSKYTQKQDGGTNTQQAGAQANKYTHDDEFIPSCL